MSLAPAPMGAEARLFLRDEELEAMVRAEPKQAADVSRTVTAAALLHEREVVLARLRRRA